MDRFIKVVVFLALIYGSLVAYSYFNPNFQLSKYTPVALIASNRDNTRKDDLKRIQQALGFYWRDHGSYPAAVGWCGFISSSLYPQAKEAIETYFPNGEVPKDPSSAESNTGYFYVHVDSRHYALLAHLETLTGDSPVYEYKGCNNWPSGGNYNYQVTN